MTRQNVFVDPDIFTRTAALFSSKRQGFEQESIEALSGDIVRRIVRVVQQAPHFDTPGVSEQEIEVFCDILIKPDPEPVLAFIDARRAEGLTRQGVYLGYIGAAARRLGKGWEEDRLSFLDVTYGTGHLYALMRALRAESPLKVQKVDHRKRALFATVPGEKHGIGITIAADLFRDDGWDIDLKTDTEHDKLIEHVEKTHPRIIGLSLSTGQRLDALVRLVVAMRIGAPHTIIGVAPGGDLSARKVRDLVDIDLIFEDPRTACADLDRLIELRDDR